MKIVSAAATDPGRVREGNEDSFVVDERLTLFAVADGMGGHLGGEVASATAIEALRAAFANGRPLEAAVHAANAAVFEKASGDPQLTGMGTTLTAVIVTGGARLLIGHVGDSRAYLLHDGALSRLTEDHSLVEELVREGRLTAEQAESHPRRAIITRALGVDEDIDVDLYTVHVTQGDRVLVCSDGLNTMLREREIESVLRTEHDTRLTANRLVEAANEAGGDDNITVIVLDIVEVDEDSGDDEAPATQHATAVTPAVVAAPDVDEPSSAAPAPRRRRGGSVALILVPLLFVTAVALGAIAWYDHHSWYVSAENGTVVVFRGRPHPIIWSATRDERTDIPVALLTPLAQQAVRRKMSFDSRSAVFTFLRGAQVTPTTTRPRPTTTTVRKRRTTPTTRRARPTTTTRAPAGP